MRRAAACLIAPAALCLTAGCAVTTPLQRPAWVAPWTPREAAPGLVDAVDAPGLQLKTGDVLYLRRWSAGIVSPRNDSTPQHTIDRVPLRRIASGGRLHDYEATLLTNFLVTNREDAAGNLGAPVVDAARTNAVDMWNAFLDTLRVHRVGPEALRVVASLDAVLAKSQLTDAQRKYFRTDLTGAAKEIAGIDTSLKSPYEVVSGTPSANDRYYQPTPALAGRLFTFVSVDSNGVDFRRPGYEESAWTLQEIQDSGICSQRDPSGTPIPLQITALQVPGSGKTYRIDDDRSTHVLAYAFQPGQHYRSFVPDPAARRRWRSALKRSVLSELTMRDVSVLVWRTAAGRKPPHPAPHCQPR